jgi:hypothetical protein
MMTAMVTVQNILAGYQRSDPWLVNDDAVYHESGITSGSQEPAGRLIPQHTADAP